MNHKNKYFKYRIHFDKEKHSRTTDEVWYRRAVEQHVYNKEDTFVFTVPFENGNLMVNNIFFNCPL